MTTDIFDLDKAREERAAQREMQAPTVPIRLGGQVVANIPTELPIDVLAPLRQIDGEITMLIRALLMTARQQSEAGQRWDAASMAVDLLAANPNLPSSVLDVIANMGRALMGDDGWTALLAARPTNSDITLLVRNLLTFYGMPLGESFASSPSSTEGEKDASTTSTQTSPTTTPDSTHEASGPAPETPASSEPVAS